MKTPTSAEPRTAAAHAARRRKTETALERVRQSIVRLQREKTQISVALSLAEPTSRAPSSTATRRPGN